MLKILLPNDPRDRDYLAQMHQLRYGRFVVQFGWKEGIYAVNQMEFDEYDSSAPLYLANVGNNNRVNAAIRLIQTPQPNYTLDRFRQNLTEIIEIERKPNIIELSATCTDKATAPRNAFVLLMGGLMELALDCKVDRYISTSSQVMQNILSRLHYQTQEISPAVMMEGQKFVVLSYPIAQTLYEQFCIRHGFTEPLLALEEIERSGLKERVLGL